MFFANDKDEILKKSFPVMQAVANVLLTQPEIGKVAVEGHTDDRGDITHNTDLSSRRAQSCLRWLVNHSILESRLTARGYGPSKPIGDNNTLYGRAKNRRVEFHILEPSELRPDSRPPPATAVGVDAAEPPPAASPADPGTSSLPPPAGVSVGVSAPVEVEVAPEGKTHRKRAGKKLKAEDGGQAAAADAENLKKQRHRKAPKK